MCFVIIFYKEALYFMKLTHKKVCHELQTTEPVELLIKKLFPPDEQEPIERLLKLAENPMVNFWAYYDEGVFCGQRLVGRLA